MFIIGQQIWLSVIFRPKTLGYNTCYYCYVFLRFLRFFWKSKKRDFLRFLLCFTRFLEHTFIPLRAFIRHLEYYYLESWTTCEVFLLTANLCSNFVSIEFIQSRIFNRKSRKYDLKRLFLPQNFIFLVDIITFRHQLDALYWPKARALSSRASTIGPMATV